jgi:CheY-like chemotaxis protein
LTDRAHVILIVDDMLGMRRELRTVLRSRGYEIIEATSGKETLGIVTSNKVDLVLMDAVMDEMDGFAACAIIKGNSDTAHIPILMVTSLDDKASIKQAFDSGAADYITKPVNYTVLYHRLEKIFLNIQQEDQIAQQQTKLKSLLGVATLENTYKRNILQTMTDGLFVVNSEGVIETANRASHSLLNYADQEDLLGLHMDTICTDKSDFCKNKTSDDYLCVNFLTLKKAALKSSLIEIRTYLNRANNTVLPVIISGSKLTHDNNQPASYIFSFKDMTAQKKADAALWQAKIDIEKANKQLAKLNDALLEERKIIENIVLKTQQSPLFNSSSLRILAKPVEKTTGDIICATKIIDGVRRVLLGDFTGHGLTAAVGGPLISEIFYSNTSLEMPIGEMFSILNTHLLQTLDTDMFMACSCVEFDSKSMQISLFNAGLANIIIFRDGKIIHKEPPAFVPRGLMDIPDKEAVVVTVKKNDRIIMYTDGFEEATDPYGKMFGEENFDILLEQTISQNRPLEHILRDVLKYCKTEHLEDDVTLVELTC